MKVDLIRIGNSKGIRIPKPVIEQCGFGDTVELEIKDKTIVISPAAGRRSGWNEAFAAMAERGDDELLWDERPTDWDEREWQW
jgi:antitoxin MazE